MVDALSGHRRQENRHSALRLVIVLLLVLVASSTFLVTNAFDPLLVLPHRLPSFEAMLYVGWASDVSTVMFQTVTGNRILTPSVLGLDALYTLLQVAPLLVLEAAGFSSLPNLDAFVLTLLVMIGVSVALIGVALSARRLVTTLVLLGIVLGTFLRSGTTFIRRPLDPNDFFILQDRLFVSFGSVNPDLLVPSLVLTAAMSVLTIRELQAPDVVTLGPDVATTLGVDHRRIGRWVMVTAAVLVSVSTALVEPIIFLSLLVTHLICQAAGANHHVVTMPMAALVAMFVLVTGQTVLAQVLDADNVLSVIIEFLGGITLIALIVNSRGRS